MINEWQSRYGRLVSGGCDDVVYFEPRVFSPKPAQQEPRLSVDRIGACDGGTQMHRDPSIDRVADEPARGGSQMAFDYFDAKRTRHCMENQWNVRAHARTPTDPQARSRCLQPLQQGARLVRWIVKLDRRSPG